jgi:hypothetical protein
MSELHSLWSFAALRFKRRRIKHNTADLHSTAADWIETLDLASWPYTSQLENKSTEMGLLKRDRFR